MKAANAARIRLRRRRFLLTAFLPLPPREPPDPGPPDPGPPGPESPGPDRPDRPVRRPMPGPRMPGRPPVARRPDRWDHSDRTDQECRAALRRTDRSLRRRRIQPGRDPHRPDPHRPDPRSPAMRTARHTRPDAAKRGRPWPDRPVVAAAAAYTAARVRTDRTPARTRHRIRIHHRRGRGHAPAADRGIHRRSKSSFVTPCRSGPRQHDSRPDCGDQIHRGEWLWQYSYT